MNYFDIKAKFEEIYPLTTLSDEELLQHALSYRIKGGKNPCHREDYIEYADMTADEYIAKFHLTRLDDVIKRIESKLK